jgi:hypothetical protein
LALILGLIGIPLFLDAADLTLTWTDDSANEDGFNVERLVGTTGAYAQLASVGVNVTSYTDSGLLDNTTYCYRVQAFNAAGSSGYSNEVCATTAAATTSYTLTVNKSGAGTGTVMGTGINCGADCSEPFASGTSVVLTLVVASGSTFAGWSGTGCSSGTVTVADNITCTATFNLISYALTANVAHEVSAGGSAGGRVTSNPAGIDCGTDCSENYQSGQAVALTPAPNANSIFTGWTGDADCADGNLTMNANKSCTANFGLNMIALTVTKSGGGTITSAPAGIDCGIACSYNYLSGSTVVLHASPVAGFIFAGWSGGGCTGTADCSVTLTSATTITATFVNDRIDKVGVYRPSTGEWFLDQNGNGTWDGCEVDTCVQTFNSAGALPVVGDWDGSGSTKLGLFLPGKAQWWLDINSNNTWEGCAADQCLGSFGAAADIPIAGQWKSLGSDRIGTFRPSNGSWHLDTSGNGNLDCLWDYCFRFSNYANGDVPVAGDWTGSGTSRVGLYRPSTGQWFLDRNGNRSWNGCSKDACVSNFGTPEDLPVVGDWSGTGISKIGVFRPSTGEWMLDLNGNGQWDGCGVDLCISGFGAAGDIPVLGRW